MKKLLLLLLISTISFLSYAQEVTRCATSEYTEYLFKEYPEYAAKLQQIEELTHAYINSNRDGRSAQTVITIPVVVHVIWNTTSQNISEQMVTSQIRVLNEDFRRMAGTPGWNNHPAGADVKIQFKLAETDPNGLPHSGVNRVYTTKTSFSYSTDNALLKSLSYWPSDRYLNLWTANLSGGVLGYAQFPGGPALTDGVVILFSAFGDNSPFYPYNKGRTATHEVGHWVNLRHIWGDVSTCTGTDFCDDTPPCSGQYFSGVPTCPVPTQCNFPRQIQNYMDYSDDGCMNVFTNDQTNRMRSSIAVSRPNTVMGMMESIEVTQTGTEYIFTDYSNQPYASINFTSLGNADTVTVEVFPNTLPLNMPEGAKAVKRYFNLQANGSGFSANIKLYYKDSEVSGFITGENNLKLYKWVDNGWTLMGGTVNTASNFITLNDVTSLSSWAISDPNDSPLPVELGSFTSNVIGYNVHLNWSTATETNNFGFQVERTFVPSDYRNISWQEVSFVKSAGTSTEVKKYSFVDENLKPGAYLYRLRIIDNDGSFTYSNVINVEVETPAVYALEQNYPNPFNPSTTVAFTMPEAGFVSVKVYNTLGKEVAVLVSGHKDAGTHELQFNAADLPSGIYYYSMFSNGFSQTNKMLLLK
jgi:hypothetical protein